MFCLHLNYVYLWNRWQCLPNISHLPPVWGDRACRVDLRVCKSIHPQGDYFPLCGVSGLAESTWGCASLYTPRVTAGLKPGKGGGLASGRASVHRNLVTNHFMQIQNRKEFTQVICVRDIRNITWHLLNESLTLISCISNFDLLLYHSENILRPNIQLYPNTWLIS